MFEKEGVLAALVIFVVPFVLLSVFERVLPMFDARRRETEEATAPSR
jgi:hypothetical protein